MTTSTTATDQRPLSTPETITVLKHLANGRTPDFVAAATGLTAERVREVGQAHGHPDRDHLAWAVDELQRQDDEAAVATLPAGTPADRLKAATAGRSRGVTPLPTPRAVSKPASPAPASVEIARVHEETDERDDLLAAAARSDKARTRNLGEKITTLLAQLRGIVADESTAAAAAAEAAKDKAARDAEIAQLRARLAVLEGKPAPKAATSTAKAATSSATSSSDAKAVRAWAAANGIDCPAMGRVPGYVRSQYDAATDSREAMRDSA